MSQNDASLKVQEHLRDSSAQKTQAEIENTVFDELMYDEENPKRPVGFGFGVDRDAVFGVNGALRKRGYSYTSKRDTEIKRMKEEMTEQKQLTTLLSKQLLLVLEAVDNGPVSKDFLDAARLAVRMAGTQVSPLSVNWH